jgi:hypothetical protein
MTTDPSNDTPHPMSKRDVQFLIGLLAIVENMILVDAVDDEMKRAILVRLRKLDLIDEGADTREMHLVLDDMNQRLRLALGEYDVLPEPRSKRGGGKR